MQVAISTHHIHAKKNATSYQYGRSRVRCTMSLMRQIKCHLLDCHVDHHKLQSRYVISRATEPKLTPDETPSETPAGSDMTLPVTPDKTLAETVAETLAETLVGNGQGSG